MYGGLGEHRQLLQQGPGQRLDGAELRPETPFGVTDMSMLRVRHKCLVSYLGGGKAEVWGNVKPRQHTHQSTIYRVRL